MRELIHVTHQKNIFPIVMNGLRPNPATRRLWVATKSKLAWLKEHVANRHGWDTSDLVVLWVRATFTALRRTRTPGIYWTRSIMWNVMVEDTAVVQAPRARRRKMYDGV